MTTQDEFSAECNRILNRIMQDCAVIEGDAARKDPAKFAVTLVMERGKAANVKIYPKVWRTALVSIQWGYTVNRNAAGRFLVFREIVKHKRVKRNERTRLIPVLGERDQWRPFVSKSSAIQQARLSYEADLRKYGKD